MGKTVIDFGDYNPPTYDEYDGDEPRPGWYTFELQKVGWYGDDQESLRWIFVIADGPFAGWAGFVFGNMSTTKWKNQEATRAIQGGSEKKLAVDFDSDKEVAALIKRAKRVRGKVENNTNPNTGETRLSLRKVRPLLEDTSTRKASEPDDLDEVEDAEGDDEPYTAEELADMDIKELKGILKDEFDLTVAELRTLKTVKAAAAAILEAQEEEPEEETEGDAAEDADEDDDFDDDFDEDADADEEVDEEPEPEPEPAPRRRRAAAPTKAAPAKKAAAAVPAQRTRRTRR